MTISFIGSGNVATHLAQAAVGAGHQVKQVLSREYDHAARLANKVGAKPITDIALLSPDADIYILAVSDDALFDLALDLHLSRKLVVHTSGSVPMDVLKPICRHHGVLWAPQTFVRDVRLDYSHIPFCIEASDPISYTKLEQFAASISDRLYRLDGAQRLRLHLASVMVNNFGNALNALAQDMLRRQDIPFEILHPIIEATADKIHHGEDLWKLQTGPAIRRDTKSIDSHRRLLADDPDMLQLYDVMTKLIDHATH